MDTPKDFKALIEEYLRQEGHSQAYFAKKLQYTPDQLNKWLLGVNRIPYDAVRKICCSLNLSKRQQLQIFALAGYPLPKWVEEMLVMAESQPFPASEDELGFDPLIIGKYEGESQEYRFSAEDTIAVPGTENIERFSIEHAKGGVAITGRSFKKTTRIKVSTWNGRLWNVENENTLYFGIELDAGSREICTLIIRCENEAAEGWFYTGRDHQRLIYKFDAKKVDTPP
ncbi:MAG: helix-turn-helix transcriptional regulator [Caldilineaceae bacterium]